MADIFLSYASADRALITPLAKALTDAGFTLWWDRDIRPGIDFSETIEREIAIASAVVVAWSGASIRSQWVRDEAAYARKESKLIPLQLDDAEAPMGFRQIQAIDFRHWRADPTSPEFASLVAAVRDLVGRAGDRPTPVATQPSTAAHVHPIARRRRVPVLAALALIAGALATWAFMTSYRAPGAHDFAMGSVEIQPFIARPPDADRAARAASYASAFRQRFAELGIPTAAGSTDRNRHETELILVGELDGEGARNVLTARLDDRKTGATLWSVRREPTEGAAWEANVAGFALKCALRRRDPALGTQVLSRYLHGCANFLQGEFRAFQAVSKQLYEAAPTSANAMALHALASVAVGWSDAHSKAEHDRFVGEGVRLAELALKADPHNADAMFTMGFSKSDFQLVEQERWWRRALEADPELGWALGRYANLLSAVGRIREAVDVGLRAQLHRRLTSVPVAGILASVGAMQEAKAQYDLVRPMDPEQVGREELETDLRYGDVSAAARTLRDHPALAGEDLECWKGILAARRKEPLDAGRFAKACGDSGESSARAFALAGDLDAAYRAIEVYLDSGGRFLPHLFWPEMRNFRRDPRFWPLAARLGLVDYWMDTDQWPDMCSEPDLPIDCKAAAAKARVSRTPADHPQSHDKGS